MSHRYAGVSALLLAGLMLTGMPSIPMPSGRSLSLASSLAAQDQPMITPLFFTGVVGNDAAQGRRVLLRWYTVDDLLALESVVLFRTDLQGTRTKLSVVKKTRNPAVLQSIFYNPGADAMRADLEGFIADVYGTTGNSPQQFVNYVVDFMDSGGSGDTATARRLFATQYNYGLAMMEGLAYLDHVDPTAGPFTYELWQGDAAGNALHALGKVEIDATAIDYLPAPQQLVEVFLRGRDGVTPARGNNRKIFLNWQPSADTTQRHINFGYNVYRLGRAIGGGETFESVRNELVRINSTPIMPPSPIEEEQNDQSYAFADSGDWLETDSDDDLLPVGDTYTYFAVARDLLGQEGAPSNPLIATVRDTYEPEMVRGINVDVVQPNEGPYLQVSWLPVPDADVASYRVYRYREYANTGKPGPFAPVDGYSEGLLADIPLHKLDGGDPKYWYVDSVIDSSAETLTFWYSISAVDEHGNESAISPGVFGTIDDVEGPQSTGIDSICRTSSTPTIGGSVVLEEEGRVPTWQPLFILNRGHHLASTVTISRVFPEIEPGKAAGEIVELVGTFPLDSRGPVFAEDGPFEYANLSYVPIYRFEVETIDKQRASLDIAPPAEWEPLGPRAVYTINTGIAFARPICEPVEEEDHLIITVVPGFEAPPLQLTAPCVDDSVSMRLMRSVNNGRTWDLVGEVPCGEDAASLADHYHPESLTRARYSLVALDKHGNPGIPHYLPYDVIYLGSVTPPAPIEAVPTGLNTPANRRVRMTWQGPADGIEMYRVHFRNKNSPGIQGLTVEEYPLEFSVPAARSGNPPADFSYDEGTGIFTATAAHLDRNGAEINPQVEYEILIEAVPYAGNSVYGSRKMSMHWGNYDNLANIPQGTLRWAARPLAPIISKSTAYNQLSFRTDLRGGSVLIPITSHVEGVGAYPSSEPPLMVWRRREDKPNQPWVAVTPLLTSYIRTNGIITDPYFTVQDGNVWALDNTGILIETEYQYVVMTFDPTSLEILGLWGPYEFIAITPGR